VLHAVHFSKTEKKALSDMLSGKDAGLSGRTRERFMEKLALLNGKRTGKDVS